jgi:hypothetical protein
VKTGQTTSHRPRPARTRRAGGGTELEYRYGALLLAHLLTGDPVTDLGDDVLPVQVAFQAGVFSPVDHLATI